MQSPYLLFLGDVTEPSAAKTAAGIRQWRGELCAGQLRFPGCTVDLGLPELTPEQAATQGVRTMIIGIVNVGGFIPDRWIAAIVAALEAGLDVCAGMHQKLSSVPQVREAAERCRRTLFDVRHAGREFMPGTGTRRPGKRLLTVGTDCSVGKKYTALAIEKAMRARHERRLPCHWANRNHDLRSWSGS